VKVLFEITVKGVLGAEPPRKSVEPIGGVFFPKFRVKRRPPMRMIAAA
jgi:hypothetical protein